MKLLTKKEWDIIQKAVNNNSNEPGSNNDLIIFVDYFYDFPPAAPQSLKWKLQNWSRYLRYWIGL